MTILGFSSSPIHGGNVDRLVQTLLERSGNDSEFVNLTSLSYTPCKACVDLCANDNLCKLEDDLKPFYSQLIAAEAIILETPSYFNNLNSYMAAFLERLWSFRHRQFPLQDKPFVVVAVGGIRYPQNAIDAVTKRMKAYQAECIGSMGYVSKIFPCYVCGYGQSCTVGSFYKRYGEEGRKSLKVTPDLFHRWEDSPEIVGNIKSLGKHLANLP